MNDESTNLQRSQMKKPSLPRHANNNLSSPFPFMEFGLSTSSSLNNILNHIPREIDLGRKNFQSRNDIQYSKELITDPYSQPLNMDRLKSLNREEMSNGIPKFIRTSTNDLRNNNFSPNIFLRLQSARTDTTHKDFKITNGSVEQMKDVSKLKFLHRDQRPKTGLTLLNKRNTFLGEERKDFEHELIKPNLPLAPPRPINGSLMPVLGTKTGTKFYVKSFKTDALIYNSNEKLFQQEIIKDVPSIDTNNSENKTTNSQSIYLQVKNEVAEYRKQRLKEVNLNVDVVPKLKAVSVEDFNSKKEDKVENNHATNKVAENFERNQNVDNEVPLNGFFNYTSEDSEDDENMLNRDFEIPPRAKSVTFNDKVETREIMEESGSDNDGSNDSDDDSDRGNSTEDESRGSVVSTETESDEEGTKVSLENQVSTLSTTLQTNIKEEPQEIIYFKDDNDTSPSDEEPDNISEMKRQFKDISPTLDDKLILNEDSTLKETSLSKSTNSTESFSSSSSSLSNNACNSIKESRSSSGSAKLRVSSKTIFKKSDLKKGPKLTMSKEELLEMKVFKETQLNMPLIFSQYPFVPPVINFVGEGEKIEQLPWQLRKLLRWRTSLLTPVIVKQIITRSGFRPSRLTTATDDLESVETNDWILYFGKHMKGPVFKTLKDYQKVNHFPGSFQLGRKDRLWRNIYKMQQEVGKKEFDFIPQTFCLPTDLELFKQCWENGGNKHKWIIKPPASARGIGVKVVHKWNQIPKRRPIVVQRYISDPYLINESKFDLRLYVFLASINPLRIYLYDDGLVRFASTKYTNSLKTLHNRFVHLTNYSVNKLNVEYMDNNDNEACKGHKWSLKSLWNYLRKRGVNTDNVWDRIKDLVIKTVISAEEMICASVKAYCASTYNIKELFGFDVLLDENLKPWILEVNVSPSLHSDTPLDVVVKGGMIKDTLNLSGFMLPEHSDIDPPTNITLKSSNDKNNPSSDLHIDQRLWLYTPSEDENAKSKYFVSLVTNGQSDQRFDHNDFLPCHILDCLTPNDVRCLVESYDEYNRKGHFQRIYPVSSTVLAKKYLSCFERVRYSNLLLATFLTKYSRSGQDIQLLEKLCQKKLHILSSENGDKIDPRHIWSKPGYSGDN